MLDNALELYITAVHPCPYLPERQAMNLLVNPHSVITNDEYGHLLNRGFRRSGNEVYRPCCRHCSDCISTRIPVHYFRPDRSQKRNWKRNQDLIVKVNADGFKPEYEPLYRRYVSQRHSGGGMDTDDVSDFANFLKAHWSRTVMVEVYDPLGQLLAVATTDWLQHGLSLVYTFYDPDVAKERGLGTFCILWQIHWAKELGLDYVYPGYWIADSPKMNYKTKFSPMEGLMDGRWVALRA